MLVMRMMHKDFKADYYEYLKYELNYSDNTIKSYIRNVNNFLFFLDNKKISYLEINKEIIIKYLKYLDNQRLSNRTISNILSSLRSYYEYLQIVGTIDNNVFKLISNPKLDKKLPNFLSYEEMRKILDSLGSDTILEKRNVLIIELLYATGVRVSELTSLKLDNIDFTNKSIRIYGKGRKERIVYYGDYAKRAMDNYLKTRTIKSDYLILNKDGKKISERGIEQIVSKISHSLAIKNKVSPHTFRHTFATHLLNNGADIKSVQELLGHSNLNTTEVYTHITNDYLKEVYRKNMPR